MICQHGSFQNDLFAGSAVPVNTNGHYFTLLFIDALDRYDKRTCADV